MPSIQEIQGECVDVNVRLPGFPAPETIQLQSQPPVDCTRGSEVVLPGSCFDIFFSSQTRDLKAALSKEPRLVVDVWHR